MSITSTNVHRIGAVTTVTVISDLVGTVYYHWYLDGAYVGETIAPTRSFSLAVAEQARLDVVDTLNPDFDALAAPPAAFPGRYTVHWVRSLSADVKEYLVEQQIGAGAWVELARVPHDPHAWDYYLLTGKLTDLMNTTWRITTLDIAGNVSAAEQAGPIFIVRIPDAPKWVFTWDPGTQRITYAAA